MENTTVYDGRSSTIKATGKLVIKHFIEAMSACKPEKKYESDTFKVGDIPLAIRVYPDGQTEADRGYVSIYLRNMSDEDISVKCEFITDVETKDLDYTDTIKAGKGFGYNHFLTHAQCRDTYKDKDFTVTANVEIPGEDLKIIGSGSTKSKFSVWENVYNKMQRTTPAICPKQSLLKMLSEFCILY